MLEIGSARNMMGFAFKLRQKMCRTKFKLSCADVKKDRDGIFLGDGEAVDGIGKDSSDHIMAHVLG